MFNRKIKEELAAKTSELSFAKNEIASLKSQLQKRAELEVELKKTKEELDEVKKKVRGQIEADLLVNAFKAVGIIREDDKKPTQHYFNQQALLQNQLAALNCNQSLGAGLANIFSGFRG